MDKDIHVHTYNIITCLSLSVRYLASEIEQGLGKEIRCPEHNCYKIVPIVRE